MVNPSDFKNGMTIEWEGGLWIVVEFQQGQNARGDTFFRPKLRNVRTGAIIDQKFRDKDRFARARIEKVAMQYLYSDGDRHFFMNLSSYDQLPLGDDQPADGGKPASVETGLILNVPFFVNEGDVIRVDTRTGAYVERV